MLLVLFTRIANEARGKADDRLAAGHDFNAGEAVFVLVCEMMVANKLATDQ